MYIKKINLTKSKTVGMVSQHGRTQFKKVQIMAEGEMDREESPEKAYEELSQYIEGRLEYEKNIK